ncbi:MAG: hypothetical protein Q8M16_16190 [Pirellulaceae bacterium]|nr:hypothetical protein [Pirellulaceae bacterium]
MLRKHLTLTLALILGVLSANQVFAFDGFKALSGRAPTVESSLTTLDEFKTILNSVPKENFREVSDRVFVFEVKHAGFILPTIATRSPEGNFIWNAYRLAPIPEDVPAEKVAERMIKLLAASGEGGDFFFSVNEETRMITVHGCIQVHGKISTQFYIDHLIVMGDFAAKCENLWNPEKWDTDEPKHIGQWESEGSGMTLKLQPSNHFELIVGSNVTKGKFKLDGNTLIMEDSNGDKLSAEIKFDNPNQFQLIVADNTNIFVRL